MTNQNLFPRISIIIPAFNEENVITDCLESIFNLDYPKELLDIIIVDDGSTDKTPEIISKYKNINIIKGHHKGPSAARNLAIKEARGEFLAFTDADCVVHPDWLKQLLSEFTSENIVGVGGIQKPVRSESYFGIIVSRVIRAFGFISGYSKAHKIPADIDHNASCNVLYKTEIIKMVGGFDENLWPGEDVELDYKIRKLGYRLRQNPAAVVEHFRPRTLKQYNRMMYRYGMAQAYLVKKFGIFRALQVIPFIAAALPFFLIALMILLSSIFGMIKAGAIMVIFIMLTLFFFGLIRGLGINLLTYIIIISTIYKWHMGFYYYYLFGKGKPLK